MLNNFGSVVWLRSPVERHPTYGYLQVSFIAWRFEEPRDSLKGIFEAIIRETPNSLEWTFKATRNWMIAPTRLIEQAGPDGSKFNEAMVNITEEDQEFCAAAREDLFRILEALESASH
ncbi:hypothetical protein [Streptomyces sp. MZ04]|uniref:hypothetical protein n=1 Tax=Streptomyces sp. MZ04 TaxID=2559236 RepID=UPI00107E8B4D|nr:hypothetical protein [Streptomyces sp. MZ04]TGB07354.1 hypothetical protein E2651_21920 [Streptomyces sp. MZ04]